MNKNITTDIVNSYQRCVFLSPHLDDAALSCHEILTQLSGKLEVTIVNICTSAGKASYTLSARKNLADSGYATTDLLFAARRKEDFLVQKVYGNNSENLNYEDALYRKKNRSLIGKILPEIDHLYPTYKWAVVKKISRYDLLPINLKTNLKKYKRADTLVFAPYSIGGHVDHRIVRKVSETLFEHLVLYSDFPYNTRLGTYGRTPQFYRRYELTPDVAKKEMVLKLYKTQYSRLFPDGKLPTHKEVYFYRKK